MKTRTTSQKYLPPEAEHYDLSSNLPILASSQTEGYLESYDSLTDYQWN